MKMVLKQLISFFSTALTSMVKTKWALFFQARDLIHTDSVQEPTKCGTKYYKIKIVNRTSKTARIAKLGISNENNFIAIAIIVILT